MFFAVVAAGSSPLMAQNAGTARADSLKPGDKQEWAQFKDAPPPIYRLGIEERNGYDIGDTRKTVTLLVGQLYSQAKDIPYSDYAGFSEFIRNFLGNMNHSSTADINRTFFEGIMAGDYDCDRACFVAAQVASMRGYRVSFVFTRDHVLLMLDDKHYANVAGMFDPKDKESLERMYGPICLETDNLKVASLAVYTNLALKKYRMGDYGAANALADTAIALAPGFARLYGNRALIKIKSGELKGAETDLNTGLALDPKDDWLFYLRYEASMAEKDYPAALRHLEAARKIAPKDPEYKNKMSELLKSLGYEQLYVGTSYWPSTKHIAWLDITYYAFSGQTGPGSREKFAVSSHGKSDEVKVEIDEGGCSTFSLGGKEYALILNSVETALPMSHWGNIELRVKMAK